MQHIVHGFAFVERIHVQVQDGHQTAVQRGKRRRLRWWRRWRGHGHAVLRGRRQEAAGQREQADRVLRRSDEKTTPERVVVRGRLRGRLSARGADIRVARQRLVLHPVDGEPGDHFAVAGQRAGREPFVRDRAPDFHFGQFPGDRLAVLSGPDPSARLPRRLCARRDPSAGRPSSSSLRASNNPSDGQ